jgi:hypothetical protein
MRKGAAMRFNFVVGRSEAEIARLVGCYDDIETALASTDIFSNGELSWCLQTFVLLARRGRLDVTCTNRLDPAAVNIVHSDTLLSLRPDSRAFVACVRADYPKRKWANYHIVQNRDQAGRAAGYLPHWVQAGIKERDPGRRGVRTVAYFGQIDRNLAGTVVDWRAMFAAHGIAFKVPACKQWHDMRETDVLMGIRSFDRNPHSTKPPSKLFNAWHAKIPFIGGHDSAYRQVATPGRDYLVASSGREALDHVLRLAEDPEFYARLVRNGESMAQEYTSETIAAKWEMLLQGEIMQRYAQWRRSVLAPVTFAFGVAAGLSAHHARHLGRRTLGAFARARNP